MEKTRLQHVLDSAVASQDAPFLVGMTANARGVTWSGASGDAAPGRAAATDTVFRIFSMSKGVGSTAAMILIDRGELDFDTPVEEVLPEFAEIRVLDGWDGDTPLLRAPKTKATARHLASHTAGLDYEFWNAELKRYMQKTGAVTVVSGLRSSLFYPMMSDPGTRWSYGPAVDWLGLMVEKISGQRIDSFLKENLFEPLGMSDTDVELRDHMADRLSAVKMRGEGGHFVDIDLAPPSNPEFYGMGHALYSTPQDYMKFLRMILNRGALDGQRILSEGAVASMLENHMGPLTVEKMISVVPTAADVDLFPGTTKTHSFGFIRFEEDIPGMRRAGSQGWAGIANTHYWFDPASDLAAVIMSQSLPYVEPRWMKTYEAFERAVYAA
ncbi:MAG: beta-lactamase family protein [Pararhodobacter sp.]|nr:beta-lactamase family protein [Pararhodobacter sp.]